jgi:hypothetical protein
VITRRIRDSLGCIPQSRNRIFVEVAGQPRPAASLPILKHGSHAVASAVAFREAVGQVQCGARRR